MKNVLCMVLMILGVIPKIRAQSNILVSQYYQVMPVFAPSLTGANDFLDIRVGTRQQWVGYEGAPETFFLSGTGTLSLNKSNAHKYNSVRISDMSRYDRNKVKVGVGGYVFRDQLGEFEQVEAMASGATHIPVFRNTYLSLGVSAGFYSTSLDLSKLFVMHPQNDDLYQLYLQKGTDSKYMKLNTGISIYSGRYYLSYSLLNLANKLISGFGYEVEHSPKIIHSIAGGIRLDINSNFEIIPNTYLRYSQNLPFLFDTGFRIRYQQNIYTGISYRNDQSVIALLGFTMKNMYTFGYSYEMNMASNIGLNSHEIILGIQLFNRKKHVPIW